MYKSNHQLHTYYTEKAPTVATIEKKSEKRKFQVHTLIFSRFLYFLVIIIIISKHVRCL